MGFPNIFTEQCSKDLQDRIEQLSPMTQRRWGKMNVSQMLAHCCIPYEQALEERFDAPPLFMKLIVKLFFKKSMTNEVPYKPNLPTSPSFVIVDQKDFEHEKNRLIDYIKKVEKKGAAHFEGRVQLSLGKLSSIEWNNLLYKHLDHHLRQFGV